MSEYKKIIPMLNKYIKSDCIITDIGSTKLNVLKIKNKELNKSLTWIMSHPIAGSEVSGPTHGTKNLFLNKWCIVFEPIIFQNFNNFFCFVLFLSSKTKHHLLRNKFFVP